MSGSTTMPTWFDRLRSQRSKRQEFRDLEALRRLFDTGYLQRLTVELRRDLSRNGVEGIMVSPHFKPFPLNRLDAAVSGAGEGAGGWKFGRTGSRPVAVGFSSLGLQGYSGLLQTDCGPDHEPRLFMHPLLEKVMVGLHESAHLLDVRKVHSIAVPKGEVSETLLAKSGNVKDRLCETPFANILMLAVSQCEGVDARQAIKNSLRESLADATAAQFMLVRYGDNSLVPAFIKGIAAFRRQGLGNGGDHRTSSALDAILAAWKAHKHIDPSYQLSGAMRDTMDVLRSHPTLIADIAAEGILHNELSVAAAKHVTDVGERLGHARTLVSSARNTYCTPRASAEQKHLLSNDPRSRPR